MDDSDNDSVDDDNNDDDDVVFDEEAAAAVAESIRFQLNTIIQRRNEFPLRQRKKIDKLAKEYIRKLGEDIHDMLCEINKPGHVDYKGLDCDRDTEQEIETAIGFFPGLLSQRGGILNLYPIQYLSRSSRVASRVGFNLKALPFIANVARLGNESNQFEVEERGGLLCEARFDRCNTLQCLMCTNITSHGREYDIRVDTVIVTQINRLRQLDLFKKEDIPRYNLVHRMYNQRYFSSRKFRFLIHWDPTVLLQTHEENGWLQLHYTARRVDIEGFELVVDYTIRYYPIMKGIHLLFQKANDGDTPFQLACQKYGRDEVMHVVDKVLTRYAQDTPLDSIEAVIVAAVDDNIHFDCVYFLIRREPDLVLRLLQPGFMNENNYDGDDDNDDDDNADGNAGHRVDDGNDDDGGDVGDNINHNMNLDDNDDDDDDDDGIDNYLGPYNNSDDFNHDNDGSATNGLSLDANNTDVNDKKRKRGP